MVRRGGSARRMVRRGGSARRMLTRGEGAYLQCLDDIIRSEFGLLRELGDRDRAAMDGKDLEEGVDPVRSVRYEAKVGDGTLWGAELFTAVRGREMVRGGV